MFWNKKKSCVLKPGSKKKAEAYEQTIVDLHSKTQQLDAKKLKLDQILHTKLNEGHTI